MLQLFTGIRSIYMAGNTAEFDKLKKSLDELRIINNLLDNISRLKETNHIMSVVINELIKATDADQGVINLVAPLKDKDLVTVVRDVGKEESGLPFKVDDQISGWVLNHKKMLKIDDLDGDIRFAGLDSDNGRYRSIVSFPLVVRDNIIGLTTLIRNQEKGAFTNDHCRLVGIIASQSAHILANARLLEELAEKNKLLELSRAKLKAENTKLKNEVVSGYGFENIIGNSAAMKRVLTLVSKFAASDSPVLITGETGTGKELIARAIHYNSARADQPLVIKNCGVKTESLLESELFGYVKGSFTGAIGDKTGLFKEADGGSIFLDEIGDAPLSTQAAILRVIQSGEIRPIGASKTLYVNVRVISATNQLLKQAIKDGRFREDLYYRLSTLVVDLPNLRERPGDIPLLIDHFLKIIRIKTGREQLSVSPDALHRLESYDWPGNVRQLEHELERAAVVAGPDGTIEVRDLSPELLVNTGETAGEELEKGKLKEAVEKLEREMIISTLQESNWNILQTSRTLGLTRKGLKDKMARYGLKSDI